MVLVNGAEGIGTGWSTNIPCFNPLDIVKNIRNRLNGTNGGNFFRMIPWYKGY
jgi:DNA topoisomerase-2